jgi:hypothetical protein
MLCNYDGISSERIASVWIPCMAPWLGTDLFFSKRLYFKHLVISPTFPFYGVTAEEIPNSVIVEVLG